MSNLSGKFLIFLNFSVGVFLLSMADVYAFAWLLIYNTVCRVS